MSELSMVPSVSFGRYLITLFVVSLLLVYSLTGDAGPIRDSKKIADNIPSTSEKPASPWLIAPLLSSNPKLGSSVGFLGGYLHGFDDKSPVSTFGVGGLYSDTDSRVYGAFANTYFNGDKDRILAGYLKGEIFNVYEDYLGTGLTVETTDSADGFLLRYLHQFTKNWFIGPEFLTVNYSIAGDDDFSRLLLEVLGIDGIEGKAVGLRLEHDSRNNQNSPSEGFHFELANSQYLEQLNDDLDFDVWTASFSSYSVIGSRQVLGVNVGSRLAKDAPLAAYSTITLRGYTAGEYLAPYNLEAQIEDRILIKGRWGATLFAGVTCLFGSGKNCDNKSNLYPSAGAGLTYLIKPEQGMVAKLELAKGQGDNYGVYLQFGNAF